MAAGLDIAGADLRRRLLAEGWEERFSASGARVDEMAATYRSLGYEVRVEELSAVCDAASCTACFAVPGAEGPVRVLFTRRGSAPKAVEDELFS